MELQIIPIKLLRRARQRAQALAKRHYETYLEELLALIDDGELEDAHDIDAWEP